MNPKLILTSAFILALCLTTAKATLAKELAITGGVRPQPDDLSVTFTSDPPPNSTLNNNQVTTFTFTYQSRLTTQPDLSLSASWQNTGLSISPFTYVLNSATGSANYQPAIDLNNQTITWILTALPVMPEPKTISFQLDTNLSLYGTSQSTVTGTSSIFNNLYTQTILPFSFYHPSPPQIPTATTTPTITPLATISPTPSPTPTSPKPKINRVEITNIKDNSASITVATNIPTTAKLQYGTDPSHLKETIRSSQNLLRHTFELTNLAPSYKYYFRLELENTLGELTYSDIFILNTAETDSKISQPDLNTIIVSNDIPHDLTTLASHPIEDRFVGITTNHPLSISISIPNSDSIRKVIGRFENAQILGISTYANEFPQGKTELFQKKTGVFSGTLISPKFPGHYQFIVQITDTKGGLLTYYLPYFFHLYPPLQCLINTPKNQ